VGGDPKVEVELVDADEPGPRGASAGSSPAPAGARAGGEPDEPTTSRRRRVRPRTLVVTGTAVVVGLVATQAVLDARERTEVARYADVPGVVAPLGESLDVLWDADLGDVFVLYAGAEVDGASVGVRIEESGAQTAVALDPATGERAWSTPLTEADELLVEARDTFAGVPCHATTAGEPLVACLVGSRYAFPSVSPEEYGGDTFLPPPLPQDFELVVLDPATGAVVRRTPAPSAAGMLVVDDLVLIATSATDGSVVVRADDVRSGEQAWEQALPAGTAERDWAEAGAPPSLVPTGDEVIVLLGTAAVGIAADGTILGTTPPTDTEGGGFVEPTRGDRVVRRSFGGPAGDEAVVLTADGSATPLPEGQLLSLRVDDDSVPEVLLLAGAPDADGGLLGWDVTAGAVRWTVEDVLVSDAVLLGGVAYVVGFDGSLRAVDLRDGTTVWDTPPPEARPGEEPVTSPQLITDGRSLVVVGRRTGSAAVRAHALRDGLPVWEGTLPIEIEGVESLGGRAVVWGSDSDRWSVLG
jgi:outer membrane protein assembly factor BamB